MVWGCFKREHEQIGARQPTFSPSAADYDVRPTDSRSAEDCHTQSVQSLERDRRQRGGRECAFDPYPEGRADPSQTCHPEIHGGEEHAAES